MCDVLVKLPMRSAKTSDDVGKSDKRNKPRGRDDSGGRSKK